jgi:hypothetical protein
MEARMAQPDSSVDLGPVEGVGASGDGLNEDAPIEAVLGRTSAQLEQARFEIGLAARLQERLLREIERLEHSLADAQAEHLELLEQVNHRDLLLSQVFSSRSWRWAQTLRRILGRR